MVVALACGVALALMGLGLLTWDHREGMAKDARLRWHKVREDAPTHSRPAGVLLMGLGGGGVITWFLTDSTVSTDAVQHARTYVVTIKSTASTSWAVLFIMGLVFAVGVVLYFLGKPEEPPGVHQKLDTILGGGVTGATGVPFANASVGATGPAGLPASTSNVEQASGSIEVKAEMSGTVTVSPPAGPTGPTEPTPS